MPPSNYHNTFHTCTRFWVALGAGMSSPSTAQSFHARRHPRFTIESWRMLYERRRLANCSGAIGRFGLHGSDPSIFSLCSPPVAGHCNLNLCSGTVEKCGRRLSRSKRSSVTLAAELRTLHPKAEVTPPKTEKPAI